MHGGLQMCGMCVGPVLFPTIGMQTSSNISPIYSVDFELYYVRLDILHREVYAVAWE